MFGRRTQRRSNVGIIMLLLEITRAGLDRIPPVTLATIALNVIIHLTYPSPHTWRSVCIGVQSVWYGQDYSRLLKGAFFHADDWHLYYNMASFLYKGIYLERIIGSSWFIFMLAVFTALTNVLVLYLNYAAAFLLNDISYLQQCAVGFSGVVFAVKVVTTYATPPGTSMLLGFIPVNSRSACWFELILIQFLVPNASFTGHLAGILVGLAYAKGPLKKLMQVMSNLSSLFGNGRSRRRYTYRSGRAANADSQYTGGMDGNEQLQRALSESMQQQHTNHGRIYPDLDETNSLEPTAPSAPEYGWNIPEPEHHANGMDENEQLQRALSESMQQQHTNHGRIYPDLDKTNSLEPTAPPAPEYRRNIPEPEHHANAEEIRRRRLARFDR